MTKALAGELAGADFLFNGINYVSVFSPRLVHIKVLIRVNLSWI